MGGFRVFRAFSFLLSSLDDNCVADSPFSQSLDLYPLLIVIIGFHSTFPSRSPPLFLTISPSEDLPTSILLRLLQCFAPSLLLLMSAPPSPRTPRRGFLKPSYIPAVSSSELSDGSDTTDEKDGGKGLPPPSNPLDPLRRGSVMMEFLGAGALSLSVCPPFPPFLSSLFLRC